MTSIHADRTPTSSGNDLAQHQGQDVVCVDEVSFAYHGRLALENITLHIKEGSTLGIIGPNGSGKTTLLKLMLGLAEAGQRVRCGSWDCGRGRRAPGGIWWAMCRSVICWTGRFRSACGRWWSWGWPASGDWSGGCAVPSASRSMEMLEAVGMADLAEEPIGGLSGGQQQRVFIARALVARPAGGFPG